jgi:hypothetical protein
MDLRDVIIEFSSLATASSDQFASSTSIAPAAAFCNCERTPARATETLQDSGGSSDAADVQWVATSFAKEGVTP